MKIEQVEITEYRAGCYFGYRYGQYVLVQYGRTFLSPDKLCLEPMRGGVVCTMDKDHRGRHSSVTRGPCDSCGKRFRGSPGYEDENVVFCFMCGHPKMRESSGWGHYAY